jgi:hypothetical protein
VDTIVVGKQRAEVLSRGGAKGCDNLIRDVTLALLRESAAADGPVGATVAVQKISVLLQFLRERNEASGKKRLPKPGSLRSGISN